MISRGFFFSNAAELNGAVEDVLQKNKKARSAGEL